MGITNAAGRSIPVTLTSYGSLNLPILTMGQMAEIGGVFHDKITVGIQTLVKNLGITSGQNMIIYRDVLSMEPSYTEIVRFCQTPLGIPLAIRSALKAILPSDVDVDSLNLDDEIGPAIDLAELAATLVGLRDVGVDDMEDGNASIADPSDTTDQSSVDVTGGTKPAS